MTQANDLGDIQNQLAAAYRSRVNVNIQALATQHYGATAPAKLYPCMVWFSSGDGYIKIRNPTNTAWENIGLIGPPMKWFNVDTPAAAWRTGDVKVSAQSSETGWVTMNDGTIGDGVSGATARPNPDTQALFSLLWQAGGLVLFAQGGPPWVPVSRSGSWTTDWNLHRHVQLPAVLGRRIASQGVGYRPNGQAMPLRQWLSSDGDDRAAIGEGNMPPHYHTFGVPNHGHPYAADTTSQASWSSSGAGAFPTGNPNAYFPAWTGAIGDSDAHIIGAGGAFSGTTGWAGSGAEFWILNPRVYFHFLMKL